MIEVSNWLDVVGEKHQLRQTHRNTNRGGKRTIHFISFQYQFRYSIHPAYSDAGKNTISLKENPAGLIYHTQQVEKNGFILSLLSATKYEKKKYFRYFGERVYVEFISE